MLFLFNGGKPAVMPRRLVAHHAVLQCLWPPPPSRSRQHLPPIMLLLPAPYLPSNRLLFVGKTTLAYMRQIGSGEVAAPAGGRSGARGAAKAKAEPQPADSEDTQELPARRRRTRRD